MNARRRVASRIGWGAVFAFLVWSQVVFADRWSRGSHVFSWVGAGTVLSAIVIVGWLATSLLALGARSGRTNSATTVYVAPGALAEEKNDREQADAAAPPIKPVEIVSVSDRPDELDAVNDGAPHVSLVRVASTGIELLLDVARSDPPPGFEAVDDGRVWRLDHEGGPEEILDTRDRDGKPLVPLLLRVGTERDATFFVPVRRGESVGVAGSDPKETLNRLVRDLRESTFCDVELYRLGDAEFDDWESVPPLSVEELRELDRTRFATEHDNAPGRVPVIVSNDRALTELLRAQLEHAVLLGFAVEADHLLYRSDGSITIEPVGLTVRFPDDEPIEAAIDTADGFTSSHARSEDSALAGGDGLARPGAAEVRILRTQPDLIGDIAGVSTPIAVQFVAYLATHGGRVTTSRLRDVLGSYRRDASKANKTVWSAAGTARQLLGEERVPMARNSQHYELSAEVTCDWERLFDGFQRARSAHAAHETTRAISMLAAALELFEGLPSAEDRRFEWLETEGITHEVVRVVEEGAHLLATLAINNGSASLAKWSIERGRLANPLSEALDADDRMIEESIAPRSFDAPNDSR